MTGFSNGQCGYRAVGFNRCHELAIEVREITFTREPDAVYEIGLCRYHAESYDRCLQDR